MPDLISTILIKAVALSGCLCVFWRCSGDFDQTMEAAEESGCINVQVYQYLIVREIFRMIAEYHRCYVGQSVVSAAVGNEIGWSERPQEFVDPVHHRHIRAINKYFQAQADCLGNKAAGDLQPVPARIEVNFGHSSYVRPGGVFATRFIMNCVSNGIGRPVAPFSLPDFHAVPAMSR